MENAVELPLRVGPLMRPDDYGALGLVWKSVPTIRGSLERVGRHCRLWTDNLTYEIRECDEGIELIVHRSGERRLGMRLSNEAARRHVAVNLLRESRYPVTEVAVLTGFSEHSAFNRAFKR